MFVLNVDYEKSCYVTQLSSAEAESQGHFRLQNWTEVSEFASRGTDRHVSYQVLSWAGVVPDHDWKWLEPSYKALLDSAIRQSQWAHVQELSRACFLLCGYASRTAPLLWLMRPFGGSHAISRSTVSTKVYGPFTWVISRHDSSRSLGRLCWRQDKGQENYSKVQGGEGYFQVCNQEHSQWACYLYMGLPSQNDLPWSWVPQITSWIPKHSKNHFCSWSFANLLLLCENMSRAPPLPSIYWHHSVNLKYI